jgi:glycosyltransferase involved in cell wall biosynthesis
MRDLTLVVPACNEAQRIVGTLDRITTFLEGRRSFEVIVVDDGSIDGPLAVCRGFAAMHPSVRVISLPENEGKGCAVRLGHDAPLML